MNGRHTAEDLAFLREKGFGDTAEEIERLQAVEDAAKRPSSTGRIDPFKFALESSKPATPEQMRRAGLGPSQSSAAENDCEQEEGA